MLWVCKDCTARYAVGLTNCPQCGSTEHAEQGEEDMPKITVHGGSSVESQETVIQGEHGPELVSLSEVGEQDTDKDAEGGEQSSDGNSSSASAETQSSSGGTSGSARQSTARGAANRSKK